MSLLKVTQLIEQAESGARKLNTEERRRAVAHIMVTSPTTPNTEMGVMFGVTEGAIRKDREAIRQGMADEVKEDDIGLVIADLLWDFKRQIAVLEESLVATKNGSTERRRHAETIMNLRLNVLKALQDLGYLPKNLGNMTKEIFEYAAVVIKDGSVDARPLNLFDPAVQKAIRDREAVKRLTADNTIDAEIIEEPQPIRGVEFMDVDNESSTT